MNTQITQEITKYLTRAMGERARQNDEETEKAQEKAAGDKINAILSAGLSRAQKGENDAQSIKEFIAANPLNKQKLLSYCVDFYDPTYRLQTVKRNRENAMLNVYLREDELENLRNFVKRHKNDISFGEVVYKIMDRHGMTAPQVYNGVHLRRQDFSRVTDPRCKSVTRKMAWHIIIGLHCSLEEADAVLFSAGYIRRNSKLDLIMQYFLEHGIYDIGAIDAVLENFGLKTFTY